MLDVDVSLAEFEGASLGLSVVVVALDSAGRTTSEARTVYVESSNLLQEIANVDGRILDFDGRRILFQQSVLGTSILRMRDIESNLEVVVSTNSSRGVLVSGGAVFNESSDPLSNPFPAHYQWLNGEVSLIEGLKDLASFKAPGRFAAWLGVGGTATHPNFCVIWQHERIAGLASNGCIFRIRRNQQWRTDFTAEAKLARPQPTSTGCATE
jgi:hypothetical protein